MISAFDIATRSTGWCAGRGDALPEVGAFAFDQTRDVFGDLAERWEDYLEVHFQRFRPLHVVYEQPLLTPTDKLLTIRKIYGMGFQLEGFVRRWSKRIGRTVTCEEVTVAAIKKELTGGRRAEKADMVAVARKVGLVLPTPGADDAADAFGAWLLGVRQYNRSQSANWDRRIWSPRGALF